MKKTLLLLLIPILAAAPLDDASAWLHLQTASSGQVNGSGVFGTAPAAVALFLHEGNASSQLSYVDSQRQPSGCVSPWCAYGNTSDETGLALYAFALANYSTNYSAIESYLVSLQKSDGGFDSWGSESGENTAYALWGLSTYDAAWTGKQKAVNYLLALQNADGSINYTGSSASGNNGDVTLYTALSLRALHAAGMDNGSTAAAAGFLKSSVANCFGNSNHAFAVALAALALKDYGEEAHASMAVNYLLTLQKPDGGFVDSIRTNPYTSNAFDTAWAAIALTEINQSSANCSSAQNASVAVSVENARVITGSTQTLRLSGPSVSSAYANVTLPNSSVVQTNFAYNSTSGDYAVLFNETNQTGSYFVQAFAQTGYGLLAANASFVSALPVSVGVVTTFPNGTTFLHCVTVADDSSAETALKSAGMASTWKASGFGDALTKILDVGCEQTNPWCQCSDYGTCCLLWNLWILNSSQWAFSQKGYASETVTNGSVIGNIWTGDGSKAPPVYSFNEICNQAASSRHSSSFADAYSCTSCTLNPQCTSGYCVHGVCRSSSAYCGDGFCEVTESCSSCSTDCGACPQDTRVVNVKVAFPAGSGKADVSTTVPFTSCSTAYDCFQRVASLGCQWSQAIGALACPGVTQTCLASEVNGVKADYLSGAWWAFYANGGLASVGISCYRVNAGDSIELRYGTAAYTAPSPTPSQTSSLASSGSSSSSQSSVVSSSSLSPTPSPTAKLETHALVSNAPSLTQRNSTANATQEKPVVSATPTPSPSQVAGLQTGAVASAKAGVGLVVAFVAFAGFVFFFLRR